MGKKNNKTNQNPDPQAKEPIDLGEDEYEIDDAKKAKTEDNRTRLQKFADKRAEKAASRKAKKEDKKPMSKGKKIAIGAAGVGAAAVLTGGLWMLFGGKNSDKPASEDIEETTTEDYTEETVDEVSTQETTEE